jgi:hypothetical protein
MSKKLVSWIRPDVDKLVGWALSRNPKAIDFLQENPQKIDWWNLSINKNAIN